jgi:putative transposase
MRKARFTEHQIIAVIKSVEAGRTVKDVCREAGISEATDYNWKSRYGGMEASILYRNTRFLSVQNAE